MVNVSTDTNAGGTAGTLAGKTWSDITERPDVKTRYIPSRGQGLDSCIIRGSVTMPGAFGIDKRRYIGDPNFASTIGTNPNRTLWMEAGACATVNGPATGQTIAIEVHITYYAVMWGFQNQAQS